MKTHICKSAEEFEQLRALFKLAQRLRSNPNIEVEVCSEGGEVFLTTVPRRQA
jgi:hypothetical protein